MTQTLDHYNKTALRYAEINHALPSAQGQVDQFMAHFRAHQAPGVDRPLRLLDAGSGTGRDTLLFQKEGFEVDAFDGSQAMVELSSRLTGRPTRLMRFEDLDLPADHYDVVWAMASMLHVGRDQLAKTFVELGSALVPGGLLFASFKLGKGTREVPEDGRVFTDLDEEGVAHLLTATEGFELVATAQREPPANQSYGAPWFSVVLKRTGPRPQLKLPEPSPKRRSGPR